MEEIGDVLPTALASLSTADPAVYDSTLKTLLQWTMESLNIQAAMCQPHTPYKIRHLKMGIKFTGLMLQLSDAHTSTLLVRGWGHNSALLILTVQLKSYVTAH